MGLLAGHKKVVAEGAPSEVVVAPILQTEVRPTVHTVNLLFERQVEEDAADETEFDLRGNPAGA